MNKTESEEYFRLEQVTNNAIGSVGLDLHKLTSVSFTSDMMRSNSGVSTARLIKASEEELFATSVEMGVNTEVL